MVLSCRLKARLKVVSAILEFCSLVSSLDMMDRRMDVLGSWMRCTVMEV